MDGQMVAGHPAQWGGWSSALITLSSAVLPLSLTTPTSSRSVLCLYIGMSPVRQRPFIYDSEQICIWGHRTGACYTDKLTFSHGSLSKFAYYTNMCIIFEFFSVVSLVLYHSHLITSHEVNIWQYELENVSNIRNDLTTDDIWRGKEFRMGTASKFCTWK